MLTVAKLSCLLKASQEILWYLTPTINPPLGSQPQSDQRELSLSVWWPRLCVCCLWMLSPVSAHIPF